MSGRRRSSIIEYQRPQQNQHPHPYTARLGGQPVERDAPSVRSVCVDGRQRAFVLSVGAILEGPTHTGRLLLLLLKLQVRTSHKLATQFSERSPAASDVAACRLPRLAANKNGSKKLQQADNDHQSVNVIANKTALYKRQQQQLPNETDPIGCLGH